METIDIEPISYSQIQSWLTCGEQYRLERIEKVEQVPAWWSIGGSAVHEASETIDATGLTDPAAIDEWYQSILSRMVTDTEQRSGIPSSQYRSSRKQDGDWWKANGTPMLLDWAAFTAANPVADWPGGKAVEIPVTGMLDGVPIRGYIDRVCNVNGQLHVVDLKTGNNVPKSAIQLALYRVLLEQQYAVKTQGMGYYMARKSQYFPAAEPTAEAWELLTQYAKGLVAAKQSGVFLPNPSMLCGYCSVKDKCRVKSLLVDVPKADSPKPRKSPVTRLTATTNKK